MKIEDTIAKIFLDSAYDELSPEVVEISKKQVLDGIAVALAGSNAEGVADLVEIVKEWGGSKQASIINYGIRVPAPHAAQINAAMIHALDFDDSSDVAVMHPGVCILATCLAMAEYTGKLSGQDLILCLALGTNLVHRLGRATRPHGSLVDIGWHTTPMYGVLGSAAVSAKILGLSVEQMHNSLGIAYHQASGNLQCIYDGALTKRMGPGFAARNGIISALMAKKGLTGATNWLTGKAGLINLFHQGDFDTDILVEDFEKCFDSLDLTFKPYPCCRITHAFIDATLHLMNEFNIDVDSIESISIFAGEGAYSLCSPLEIKQNPRNTVDAQFSIPWVVATAASKGKVKMADFSDKAVHDPATRKIAQTTHAYLDNNLVGHGIQPGRITIKTISGQDFTKQIDYPLGNPHNPMSSAAVIDKFLDCNAYALHPISKENTDKLIGLTKNLEKVRNVIEIIQKISCCNT